jgi:hypothetical protein
MARRKRRVISIETRREKIRYGRAYLTVECSPAVLWTPVHSILNAHVDGDTTDEDVAWAFLKSQTVAHTPSFDWEKTDIARLLPRVTAVTQKPRLQAQTPAELVPELRELEKKELEQIRASQGQVGASLKKQVAEIGKQWQGLFGSQLQLKRIASQHLGSIHSSMADSGIDFILSDPNWKVVGVGEVKAPLAGLNRSLTHQLTGLVQSEAFSEAMRGQRRILLEGISGQMPDPAMVDQLLNTVRAGDFRKLDQAIEVAAADTINETDAVDLDSALERIKGMFNSLENTISESKDSPQQQLFLAVMAAFMVIVVQLILAKLGIWLIPPEASPPGK